MRTFPIPWSLLLIVILAGLPVQAQEGSRLPASLVNAAAATDGTHVYVFGGVEGNNSFSRTGLQSPSRDSSFSTSIYRYDPHADAIERVGELPTPRSAPGVVWTGVRFVLAGGLDAEGFLDELLLYDPPAGVLETAPVRLPQQLAKPTLLWNGSHVLILGGYSACTSASTCPNLSDAVYSFDPASGTLETLPLRLPSGRVAPGFLADARAYLLGGYVMVPGGVVVPSAEIVRLDLAQARVETLAHELPTPLVSAEVAWNGTHAFLVGGEQETGRPTDRILAYEPGHAPTLLRLRLPQPRAGHAAVLAEDRLVVVGGRGCPGGLNPCDTLLSLDAHDATPANTTRLLGTLRARDRISAFTEGGETLFLLGGGLVRWDSVRGQTEIHDIDVPEGARLQDAVETQGGLVFLLGNGTFARHASTAEGDRILVSAARLPAPRSNAALASVDGRVYVLGGVGEQSRVAQIHEYDPDAQEVRTLDARLPQPIERAAAFSDGEAVYVVGGTYGYANYSDEILRLDPQTGILEVVGRLPEPTTGLAALWTGEKAYFLGGCTMTRCPTDQVLEYDPANGSLRIHETRLGVPLQDVGATWDGEAIILTGHSRDAPFLEEVPVLAFFPRGPPSRTSPSPATPSLPMVTPSREAPTPLPTPAEGPLQNVLLLIAAGASLAVMGLFFFFRRARNRSQVQAPDPDQPPTRKRKKRSKQ